MYRIACRFEPDHPRISGRTTRKRTTGGTLGHVERRGVWRVAAAWAEPVATEALRAGGITCVGGFLWVPCPTPRAPGKLCNPRRILAEYQAARRLARAAQGLVDVPVVHDVVEWPPA